jgi:hypothetical protein
VCVCVLVRSVSESQGGHHARQWHGLGPMIALGYPPRPDQGSPASCTPWCRQHRPQSEAAAQHNAPGRPVLKLPEICVVSEQVVGCRQGGRGGSMGGQAGRQAGRQRARHVHAGQVQAGHQGSWWLWQEAGGVGGPQLCSPPSHTTTRRHTQQTRSSTALSSPRRIPAYHTPSLCAFPPTLPIRHTHETTGSAQDQLSPWPTPA